MGTTFCFCLNILVVHSCLSRLDSSYCSTYNKCGYLLFLNCITSSYNVCIISKYNGLMGCVPLSGGLKRKITKIPNPKEITDGMIIIK